MSIRDYLSAMHAPEVPLDALEQRGAFVRGRSPDWLEVGVRAAADLHVGVDLTIRVSVEVQVGLPTDMEVRALITAAGDVDETVDASQRLDQFRVGHAVVVVVSVSGKRRTWSRLAVRASIVGGFPHHSSLVDLEVGSE